jgi:isoaspartyl peptidase/L-asparaginase-like protein (Ntn-hydrolase superfamily)
VAATGKGERIMQAGLGRRVHDWLASGRSAHDSTVAGVELLRGQGSIGLIAISATELAAYADRQMAWAGRTQGSSDWNEPP